MWLLDTTVRTRIGQIRISPIRISQIRISPIRISQIRLARLLASLAISAGSIFPTCALPAQTVRLAIDTTKLGADARAAVRTWHSYLTSKHGQYYANAGTRTPFWVQDEQRAWPMFDLASAYLPDGGNAEIAGIEPVGTAAQHEFRITTRISVNPPAEGVAAWNNNITATVYAVQQNGQWLLSNALMRNTASWNHALVGSLEYVFPPSYTFNRIRADSASAFVDSLADVLSVPRIDRHTYYVAGSLDEVYRIMGLVSELKIGAGGLAQPVNHQLFVGVPAAGENYRHELAHIVLRPLMTDATSTFVSEGVPTWLGATGGSSYAELVAQLADWLNAHPQVTLDSLMRPGYPHPQTYAAAAVVTDIVHEVGGSHGVRLMFDAGATASELREGLQRITKYGWPRLQQEWRERVRDQEKAREQRQDQ